MLDIRADVANALHWDIAIPRHRVTAKVDGGWVTLQGVVEWAYQRSLAEADVRRVPGVTGIKNEIAVRGLDYDQPTAPDEVDDLLRGRMKILGSTSMQSDANSTKCLTKLREIARVVAIGKPVRWI